MPYRALSETPTLPLAAGTPDVRGWEVRLGADDGAVGHVHDVICDAAGSPHYLDVDLGALQRHVLVAIGLGQLDAARHLVWLPGVTRAHLAQLPAYAHDPGAIPEPAGDPHASQVQRVEGPRRPVLANVHRTVEGGREEIRVPILEEELVVTKRLVVKEVLVIKKRKIEETREVEAELRKERVHVERRGRGTPA